MIDELFYIWHCNVYEVFRCLSLCPPKPKKISLMAEFVPVSISNDVPNTENETKCYKNFEALSLSKLRIRNFLPHRQRNPCPL
jgi:hypothetical protein